MIKQLPMGMYTMLQSCIEKYQLMVLRIYHFIKGCAKTRNRVRAKCKICFGTLYIVSYSQIITRIVLQLVFYYMWAC